MAEDDRTYSVHLSAPACVAQEAPEAHWQEPPVALERCRRGTCEVMGRTTDLEAAARWALGFGAEATVCGPPALREEMRRQAQLIAARYDE